MSDQTPTTKPARVSRAILDHIEAWHPGTLKRRDDGVFLWRTHDGEVIELVEDAENV